MRIAKIHIILLIFTISLIYSGLVILLFSYLHSSILGISSAFFSFFFLLLLGYHFLNYLFYRFYSKIVLNEDFSHSKLFPFSETVEFKYNVDYFKDELINYFKNSNSNLRSLDFYDDKNIMVMAVKTGFFNWDELLFCKIEKIKNNHTKLIFYYGLENNHEIDDFISYFRGLDLVNNKYYLN